MKPEIRRMNPDAAFAIAERGAINQRANGDADPDVSIARARVPPGVTTRWHCVDGAVERYVILGGEGRVEVGDLAPQDVGPGDVVLIPAGCRQRITARGSRD